MRAGVGPAAGREFVTAMWRRLFGRGADEPPTDDTPAIPPDVAARRALHAYHRRTSHGFGRYAAGPQELDWANQPDPFRRWAGAPTFALARFAEAPDDAGREPGPAGSAPPEYESVLADEPRPAAPLDAHALARFLFDGFSLSAAKRFGTAHWFLRVPPSSGNLHPGELHLVLPDVHGLPPGAAVWHYDPREHALERRGELGPALAAALFEGRAPGTFYAGLAAIAWREAWKYGERAFRYVQHDTGHLLACLDLAAGLSGWRARLADELGHGALARLMGLEDQDGPEAERPQALVALGPGDTGAPADVDEAALLAAEPPRWTGLPSPLSPEHVEWDVVELAERLSRAPAGGVGRSAPRPEAVAATVPPRAPAEPHLAPLRELVRRRRSALGYERRASLDAAAWYAGLARLLPDAGRRPFALWPHTARVHPVFFVHAVAGVEPGLYLLARGPGALERLAPAFTANGPRGAPPEAATGARGVTPFESLDGAPPGLPLVRLARGDVRSLAAGLACGQELAGDAVYAVAMLAELDAAFDACGPPAYRRAHWEAGLLGQVMYLEAEARGLRGTGIGCFFDVETQRSLGLVGDRLVTLYHFAVGAAIDDPRLVTSPPYGS